MRAQATMEQCLARTSPRPAAVGHDPALDDPAATFRQLLGYFRRRTGRSQNALAQRACVDASYINRLERGEREPPAHEVVEALGRALDLPPDEADRLLWSAGYVPGRLRRLSPAVPTLAAVIAVLIDAPVSAASLADFCTCVETMARRWARGTPALDGR